MNGDEPGQLEELLRGLPLRPPSPELDERVSSVWRARSTRWQRVRLGGAVAASVALAAGILLIFLLRNPGDGQPGRPAERTDRPSIAKAVPGPSRLADQQPAPVRIEQVWSTPQADEVVVPDDALPMRRMHHQVLRHVRWIDERRNVHIEWNIPSQETVVVPLQYN